MLNSDEELETYERLKAYPSLLKKVKGMLDLMEKKDVESADDFEEALIPEVRKLGKEIIEAWACREEKTTREDLEKNGNLHHSKKKLYWNTTFGKAEIIEQIFLINAKIYRPTTERLRLHCRGYSRPLQRAITDFGADMSFEESARKMEEHYGLDVPACTIRKITESHGEAIASWEPEETEERAKLLIAEMDGSMVPILELGVKEEGVDLRKTRKVCWKEAKLCFARPQNKVHRIYGAIIGPPEKAGIKLYECAIKAGLGEATYVHGLGDGAQWIVDQFETQFGTQAHFVIDFFHTCEYLAEASHWCDALDPKGWLKEKKKMMKAGECKKVLSELKMRLIQLEKVPEDSGIIKCVRYIEKRVEYMNYGEVKQKQLPIGSGEIESSHRHIIQKRLKISGAWWKTENANTMLQLRVARANGYWKGYWDEKKAA